MDGALLVLLIILGVILVIAIIAAAVFLFVFWILMLVDAVKRSFKSDGEKIAWVLIIIFLQIIGAIVYYFAVKKQDKIKIGKKRK
jgi:NADH:ubiquinone oxidoreductase subunit 6 (subunit J)